MPKNDRLGCCRDSDSTVSANRPFRFPFFDALYQRVKISADGYLSFADGSLPYPNTDPIPLTLPPNNILAPYWTNINIGMCGGLGAGGVWTLAQGEDGRFQWDEHSTFVIEWKGVSCHDIAAIWVAFFSRCQRYRC